MIQTINVSAFRDAFKACGRADQFSYEALGLLFDYLEDVNNDYDLDVVALCCEYAEDSVVQIAESYGLELPEDETEEEHQTAVLAYLNDHTSVIGVTPSGIVYAQF